MTDFIETPHELRKYLGVHLKHIKHLDPLERERKRTERFKKELIKKYGKRCVICGIKDDVEVNHIVPLEVGAETTEKNLVLLCSKCHDLYHEGYISINAMKKLAEKWKKGESIEFSWPPIEGTKQSSPAMTPPPESLHELLRAVLNLQNKGWYKKAIETIEPNLHDSNLDNTARSYLCRKKAELTRRRSARGVITEALNVLQNIDEKKIPPQYRPIFFYELGYVHRLGGNHSKAALIYQKSAEASEEIDSNLEYIAASVNEIVCLLAAKERLSRKEAKEIIDKLTDFETIAKQYGEYWGGRWALNCAAFRLEVYLKNRDEKKSLETLQQVRDLYYDSDIFSGWDAASKQSISFLEGLTRVFFPRDEADLDTGIGLLARAFVTRTGPRQRPEGIRDVGLGLVEGCRKAESKLPKKTIDSVERIMYQTIDGTSVLWPWTATG